MAGSCFEALKALSVGIAGSYFEKPLVPKVAFIIPSVGPVGFHFGLDAWVSRSSNAWVEHVFLLRHIAGSLTLMNDTFPPWHGGSSFRSWFPGVDASFPVLEQRGSILRLNIALGNVQNTCYVWHEDGCGKHGIWTVRIFHVFHGSTLINDNKW